MHKAQYYQDSPVLQELQPNHNLAIQSTLKHTNYFPPMSYQNGVQLSSLLQNSSVLPNTASYFDAKTFGEVSSSQSAALPGSSNKSDNCKALRAPISSPTVRSSMDLMPSAFGFAAPSSVTHDSIPRIELANRALWQDFHKVTNEMVVNKPGRKMFPKVEIKISGLDFKDNYFITLAMRPVDNCKYKFQAGCWSPAGHDVLPEWSNHVTHHEGPAASGEFWMRNPLAFDRVKLTNKPNGEGSQISLVSMHKYQPVISLYLVNGPPEAICVFQPKELEFIAVTAYQSQEIINLKILHNPFAKGFREGSARKRSLSVSPYSRESSANSNNSPPLKKQFTVHNQNATTSTAPLSQLSFIPNFATAKIPNYYSSMFGYYTPPFYPQQQQQFFGLQNQNYNPYFSGLMNGNAGHNFPSNQFMATAFSNPVTAAATLAMLTGNPAVNAAVSAATPSVPVTSFARAAAVMAAAASNFSTPNTAPLPVSSASTAPPSKPISETLKFEEQPPLETATTVVSSSAGVSHCSNFMYKQMFPE